MAKITVMLPVELDEQRFKDLLVSAVEGGSTYWARFQLSLPKTERGEYDQIHVTELEAHSDQPPVRRVVKATDLADGLQKMAALPWAWRHLADFIKENDDAETADVVLQMTVFGELVYG